MCIQANLGRSLVSCQSFCRPRPIHVCGYPSFVYFAFQIEEQVLGVFMGHCGTNFIFYDCYWCVYHFCMTSVSSFFNNLALMFLFKFQFLIACSVSGPMTGFYLYFALTKREFSLGSWRERMIEVRISCRKLSHFFQHYLLSLKEKKRRLYDKNDFPIAEFVFSLEFVLITNLT